MLQAITVSTLNNQIKSLLEAHFLNIFVKGEVSRVTYHSSGHLYFTLKDKNSGISVVMFKGNNQKLKFRVEEGMEVIISGGISVYTPRGSYQINCSSLEPEGDGALALAYEQLKAKLEQKGYFDKSIKKALPKFPKHIAIVTSKTGAAISDMLNVANKRWPLVKITLFDTLVQGRDAGSLIANSIASADKIGADIIIVGRGGGSLEDLWAFNEEIVATAIYEASTPIVSAVGHQIDFLISDEVSDLRAPTPSAAIELVLPDINEILIYLDSITSSYNTYMKKTLENKSRELQHQKELLKRNSFEERLLFYKDEIKNITKSYQNFFLLSLNQKEGKLKQLLDAFSLNNPSKKDKTGYAQISKNGDIITLDELNIGDTFSSQNSKVEITSKVLQKRELQK